MTYEDGANLVYGYLQYSVIQGVAELELLIQTMTTAGASADAIREYLLYDLENGGRIFGAITGGITSGTSTGITSASQIAQMLTYEEAGVQEYKWVTVSKNPCFQCKERAGRVEEMAVWELIGLPRSGFSICRGNCRCHIEPAGYQGDSTIIME
jgi:hypothetical protein